MNRKTNATDVTEAGNSSPNNAGNRCSSRRKFLGQIGAALAGGAVLAKTGVAATEHPELTLASDVGPMNGMSDPRVRQAVALRRDAATREGQIAVPAHTTNGDEVRYPDKSGTYSKGILQDGIGLVNLPAFQTFRQAINAGTFAAFENVILGGTRKLNGPLGGNAFSLEGCEDVQFGDAPSPINQISKVVVPPAPALASAAYGTELVELYWASLLRDVSFTDYASDPMAAQAAAELTGMPTYAGPRNGSGHVTPDLLFRGPYPGETVGPYMSQLHLIPTYLGAQPISQQIATYLANVDYMN